MDTVYEREKEVVNDGNFVKHLRMRTFDKIDPVT